MLHFEGTDSGHVRVCKVHVNCLLLEQAQRVKSSEPNFHFDCLECKHKELVCASVFDGVCVRVSGREGRRRKRETDLGAAVFWRERQRTVKKLNCAV